MLLKRRGMITAALSALVIVFITTNFYEYRTVRAMDMLKPDLNLSGSGWVVEHTFADTNLLELKRPRLHLP
jgi:hypothetical protein